MLNNRRRKALSNNSSNSGGGTPALPLGNTTNKTLLSFRSTAMGLAGLLSLFLVIQWTFSKDAVSLQQEATDQVVGTVAIDLIATLPDRPDYQGVSNVITQIPVTYQHSESNAHPLQDCSPTAQVRLLQLTQQTIGGSNIKHHDDEPQYHHEWVLQTLDVQGKEKKVGGDEYYVTWYDYNDDKDDDDDKQQGTLVAVVEDLKHGWYRLDFVTSPMQSFFHDATDSDKTVLETNGNRTGHLTVDLVYTCGIGHLGPPQKDGWKSGAPTRVQYTQNRVPQPPHRVFRAPTTETDAIDLRPYHQAIFFGDASMKQMVRTVSSKTTTTTTKSPFFRAEVEYKHNPKMALDSSTVQEMLEKLEEWHGDDLKRHGDSTALVVGSAVWDLLMMDKNSVVQGPDFEDHLQAARLFVTTIRERYPNCFLVWKSPTALHLHRVQPQCLTVEACRHRTWYMSESRSRLLHEKQKALMQELQVPYMDLYEASYLAADYIKWNDGQHYVARFNRVMLAWMYQDDASLSSRDFYEQAIADDDAVPTTLETPPKSEVGATESPVSTTTLSTTTTTTTSRGGW